MGARFLFNCYKHCEQLLLCQLGEPSVTLLVPEGVTQGDPLSMFLYRITLFPLVEELQAVDPGLFTPFYLYDAEFDGLVITSVQLLKLLMEKETDRGYFSKPARIICIADSPDKEEAAKREFSAEVFDFTCIGGSTYLGAYLAPQEELESWVKPTVEAWSQGVRFLRKIS